jgi:hypothetical protein
MTTARADRFGRYAEYRQRGEDRECAALRIPVSPRTARRYEAELRQRREGRAA